jgi:hypothetical protein
MLDKQIMLYKITLVWKEKCDRKGRADTPGSRAGPIIMDGM